MRISEVILSELGLKEGADIQEVLELIENSKTELFGSIMNSEESRIEFTSNLLPKLQTGEVIIFDRLEKSDRNRYAEVILNNPTKIVEIGLIGGYESKITSSSIIPTRLENLIFVGIISGQLDLSNAIQDEAGSRYINWSIALSNKAIVVIEDPSIDLSVVKSLFSILDNNYKLSTYEKLIADEATLFNIEASSIIEDKVKARLLLDANLEKNPKWRMFSLYRILENTYLLSIKEDLNNKFDKAPKAAIEEAKRSLESELHQLISLAERYKLESSFEEFSKKLDELADIDSNQFAILIRREADKSPESKSGVHHKKGATRLYKIRCSIAHAGTSDVIYEQFPDADQVIIKLIPIVESIVLKIFKIDHEN